jgi:hypothetical protein
MDRMEPVDEVRFEVTTDVHGVSEGPKLGRQRVINKVRLCALVAYSIWLSHIIYTVLLTVLV